MKKVRINQGRLIPPRARFFIIVLLLLMIYMALQYLPEFEAIGSSIVLSMVISLVWSTYRVIEIDPKSKQLTTYHLVMSWRWRIITHQSKVEKIVILKKEELTDNIELINKAEKAYAAVLILENGKKFFLLSSMDLAPLKEKLKPIKEKLQLSQF